MFWHLSLIPLSLACPLIITLPCVLKLRPSISLQIGTILFANKMIHWRESRGDCRCRIVLVHALMNKGGSIPCVGHEVHGSGPMTKVSVLLEISSSW